MICDAITLMWRHCNLHVYMFVLKTTAIFDFADDMNS